MAKDWVIKQLVYWAQVQAAGAAFDQQNGPGALTVAVAGTSVYTITMPANFTVPINRRAIGLTLRGSVANVVEGTYDEAGSAANTVVIRTWGAAAAAATALLIVPFILEIGRVEFAIGPNQG